MPNDGGQYEILSVNEFSEDEKLQIVAIGTPKEALYLPGSLTVSCCLSQTQEQEMQMESLDAENAEVIANFERPGAFAGYDRLAQGRLGEERRTI